MSRFGLRNRNGLLSNINLGGTRLIPGVLLLDFYNDAEVAYSLKKINSLYNGSAINVRRSSDNSQQDIGFSNNSLDTSALTSFVGSGNGFVTKWYDQSGNQKDIIQTNAVNQPRIVNAGSIEILNSNPTINFINSTWLQTPTTNVSAKSIFAVNQVTTYNQLQSLIFFDHPSIGWGPWIRSIGQYYWRAESTQATDTNDFSYQNSMYFNGSLHLTTDNFLNPHILSSFGNVTNRKFGVSDGTLSRFFLGKASEIVVYATDQKNGFRTDIEQDMASRYSITI